MGYGNPTESAVSFAAKMMRDGEYMGRAIAVAASYYKVEYSDVQRGLAARSGRSQAGKKRNTARPPVKCMNCGERWATWKSSVRCGYDKAPSTYSCDECGQKLDAGFEDERGLSIRWARYKPTEEPKQPEPQPPPTATHGQLTTGQSRRLERRARLRQMIEEARP